MEQLVAIADQAVDEPADRISIPFLQVPERRVLLACIDLLLVCGWMTLAYVAWHARIQPGPTNMPQLPLEWVIGAALLWGALSWLAGAYELETADSLGSALKTTGTVAILALIATAVVYSLFLKTYPRPSLGLDVIAIPVSVGLWRIIYASLLRRPTSATRLLLVGDTATYEVLAAAIGAREPYYRLLGFLGTESADDSHWWGETGRLVAVAARTRPHRIVIGPRQDMSDDLTASICACIQRGIEVVDFHDVYEEITGKLAVDHVDDRWLASLPTRASTSQLEDVIIRLLDVVGAVAGLTVAGVLSPFIAAGIVLESGRPIFYSQTRLGQGGKRFTIHKFRSMRTDAELDGARWAASRDTRTTRFGAILRRSHLDEIPQFWNVLRGEMSLVGPRPERPEFTEELSQSIPFYRLRLAVRPGLTGWKQIRVGYAATPEEHLEVLRHDLYYIKRRSLALNLQLIARTLGSVFGMDGR